MDVGTGTLIGKFSVSHGILIGCDYGYDYGYDVTSGVLQQQYIFWEKHHETLLHLAKFEP